jgi:hypothetical protein
LRASIDTKAEVRYPRILKQKIRGLHLRLVLTTIRSQRAHLFSDKNADQEGLAVTGLGLML